MEDAVSRSFKNFLPGSHGERSPHRGPFIYSKAHDELKRKFIVATILILAFSSPGNTQTTSTRETEASLKINVGVFNYAKVSADTMARARSEESRILHEAGVETVWLDCPLSLAEAERYPVCRQDLGPDRPRLKNPASVQGLSCELPPNDARVRAADGRRTGSLRQRFL